MVRKDLKHQCYYCGDDAADGIEDRAKLTFQWRGATRTFCSMGCFNAFMVVWSGDGSAFKEFMPPVLSEQVRTLRAALQMALDWATGEGQFDHGRDTLPVLAEVVAPALVAALAAVPEGDKS